MTTVHFRHFQSKSFLILQKLLLLAFESDLHVYDVLLVRFRTYQAVATAPSHSETTIYNHYKFSVIPDFSK